jgi:hypothetical protein
MSVTSVVYDVADDTVEMMVLFPVWRRCIW